MTLFEPANVEAMRTRQDIEGLISKYAFGNVEKSQ